MLESCGKHPHEMGVALCRRCGDSWCSSCLVYAFGPKKPPYCMSCAMVAGGVRTAAAQPSMPRKLARAQAKAMRAEARTAAKATKAAGATPRDGAPETDGQPTDDFGDTDWSTPWWDEEPASTGRRS